MARDRLVSFHTCCIIYMVNPSIQTKSGSPLIKKPLPKEEALGLIWVYREVQVCEEFFLCNKKADKDIRFCQLLHVKT